MENKEKYFKFCEQNYIPIFSKPWWMDAVCGSKNWDVWLYEKGTDILAAMPYYLEQRGKYHYITKALLTQNNGIIFHDSDNAKKIAKQAQEERIINAACEYIQSLNLDVYEQQFHYGFTNWLPFFWNQYTAITRYTYVISDLKDIDSIWSNMSSNIRGKIKKGQRNGKIRKGLDIESFYREHEKIFLKQGLKCPFSMEQWVNLFSACKAHEACEIFYSIEEKGNIASILYVVWDEKSMYQLLAGSIPPYQNLDTYAALIWTGIQFAAEKRLKYDFEGSVIKRISKSFREFGGDPKPYFRIRKVFNPEIVRAEAEKMIKQLEGGG